MRLGRTAPGHPHLKRFQMSRLSRPSNQQPIITQDLIQFKFFPPNKQFKIPLFEMWGDLTSESKNFD